MPARDAIGDRLDTRAVGAMGKAGILQIRVALAGRFETGDTGENAPVQFGEHHMHGEIGRRQSALGRSPVAFARCRQRDLKHGTTGRVERGGAVIATRGKCSGVDDCGRSQFTKRVARPFGGAGCLE